MKRDTIILLSLIVIPLNCFTFNNIIFTKHAQWRAAQRNIQRKHILAAITRSRPSTVINNHNIPVLHFKLNNITVVTDSNRLKVITAFWNTITKYKKHFKP